MQTSLTCEQIFPTDHNATAILEWPYRQTINVSHFNFDMKHNHNNIYQLHDSTIIFMRFKPWTDGQLDKSNS